MWTVIDFNVVSWSAIGDSIPTLIALTLFSLIHVPINIPAYAVSIDTVADMNKELIAHGYSNIMSGLFGGLQNYFAYTQSVIYHRSGGQGKFSGLAVAACTISLYFFGPSITSCIPRCMAGTLLLHVGIDLFLEGVYDSIGKFDYVEYSGIWLIVVVMSAFGMEAAMIAGGVAAVSTHAVQSVHYVNPIRGAMTASTLRSSQWNRTNEERAILDDDAIGRSRILVVQLQGHLFFGNMGHFTEHISRLLSERTKGGNIPWIVILDFSLVLGIDSSAAQSITKLSGNLRTSCGVDLCIFVSGSDSGFPCEFALSSELSSCRSIETPDESTSLLRQSKSSIDIYTKYIGSHVEKSLDSALAFAEDALLYRKGVSVRKTSFIDTQSDDRVLALQQLGNLCPLGTTKSALEVLFSYFQRENYVCNDLLWKQGSSSDCMKLLVRGRLIALIENEADTHELVHSGNTVGELGLLQGLPRMSTLRCQSDNALLYSLSRDSFDILCRSSPESARLLDLVCIRYLSARVQHVSNRIFETRCLPI
jgi:sulfate permease, SulP family